MAALDDILAGYEALRPAQEAFHQEHHTAQRVADTDQATYLAAQKDGTLEDLITNHSPKFLPPMQPCLRPGTEALFAAALAWLAP
jgi:hypothetical protein